MSYSDHVGHGHYSDHVGHGHTWHRQGATGRAVCQCGLKLPAELSFDRSLPRDQTGQYDIAICLDRLARHGIVAPCPTYVTNQIWDSLKGVYLDTITLGGIDREDHSS